MIPDPVLSDSLIQLPHLEAKQKNPIKQDPNFFSFLMLTEANHRERRRTILSIQTQYRKLQ